MHVQLKPRGTSTAERVGTTASIVLVMTSLSLFAIGYRFEDTECSEDMAGWLKWGGGLFLLSYGTILSLWVWRRHFPTSVVDVSSLLVCGGVVMFAVGWVVYGAVEVSRIQELHESGAKQCAVPLLRVSQVVVATGCAIFGFLTVGALLLAALVANGIWFFPLPSVNKFMRDPTSPHRRTRLTSPEHKSDATDELEPGYDSDSKALWRFYPRDLTSHVDRRGRFHPTPQDATSHHEIFVREDLG